MSNNNVSLLVMAAGMGSRYGGLKQLDPMGPGGETLLDYAVYDALQAGFGRLVFIIRHDFEDLFKEKIGSRFASRVAVDYVFQDPNDLPPGPEADPAARQKPWGTTHAIWCARHAMSGPFIAINADDFYGRDSFKKVGDYLSATAQDDSRPTFAMAGYRLDRTLSEHGSVARGVCVVDEDNWLRKVDEMHKIARGEEGVIKNQEPGRADVELSGSEPVSMNFWGFTPALFPLIERRLVSFLETYGKDPKTESYIPVVVSEIVGDGEARVAVLPTLGRWFGVTYADDKQKVQASINELVTSGEYPAKLWE